MLIDLQNNSLFNFNTYPLTTAAKTDPDYVVRTGGYNPTAWEGDVWTLGNYDIIKGLEDIGRHDLAANLIYKTINMVSDGGFKEFFVPTNGSGQGSENYGWTASEFAVLIIEDLFGITYDAEDNRITIFPHIPEEYDNYNISISSLVIPTTGDKLTVNITSFANTNRSVTVSSYYPNGTISSNHYNLTLYVPLPSNQTARQLFKNNQKITTNSSNLNFSFINLDNDSASESIRIDHTLSNITFTVSSTEETLITTTTTSEEEGGGTSSFWISTYAISNEQLKAGYTKELKRRDRFKFNIDTTTYYLGIVELTNTTATINISSESQQATLSIGDEKKFELTKDNFYDLLVKLNALTKNKANLTVQSLYEETLSKKPEKGGKKLIEEKKERGWLWLVLALIVVILIVGIVRYKKR